MVIRAAATAGDDLAGCAFYIPAKGQSTSIPRKNLAPLGDRHDRRRIILIKAGLLIAALLLAGGSPTIVWLLAASLAIGLTATLAQDIVPAAATLAPLAQRGRVVGTVMTGLLMGILLSRVVSGLIAEHFGWRAIFFAAALSIALIGLDNTIDRPVDGFDKQFLDAHGLYS